MGYSSENLEYVTLCLWHFIASFKFISQYREVNKSKKNYHFDLTGAFSNIIEESEAIEYDDDDDEDEFDDDDDD